MVELDQDEVQLPHSNEDEARIRVKLEMKHHVMNEHIRGDHKFGTSRLWRLNWTREDNEGRFERILRMGLAGNNDNEGCSLASERR